jgi:hypothetical protein
LPNRRGRHHGFFCNERCNTLIYLIRI